MMNNHTIRVLALVVAVPSSTGCIFIENFEYDHENPESYTGPVDQRTTTGDIGVENVDADVDVDADTSVDQDVETNVDSKVENNVESNVESNVDAELDVTDGLDVLEEQPVGSTTAVGDGVFVEYALEGPLSETATLTPSAPDLEVDSVEWLVSNIVWGERIWLDDPAGFEWGEPQYDDDTFILALRFGPQALSPLVWNADTALCDDAGCHGRAIEAACEADVTLRVWLADGSSHDATVHHASDRVVCP